MNSKPIFNKFLGLLLVSSILSACNIGGGDTSSKGNTTGSSSLYSNISYSKSPSKAKAVSLDDTNDSEYLNIVYESDDLIDSYQIIPDGDFTYLNGVQQILTYGNNLTSITFDKDTQKFYLTNIDESGQLGIISIDKDANQVITPIKTAPIANKISMSVTVPYFAIATAVNLLSALYIAYNLNDSSTTYISRVPINSDGSLGSVDSNKDTLNSNVSAMDIGLDGNSLVVSNAIDNKTQEINVTGSNYSQPKDDNIPKQSGPFGLLYSPDKKYAYQIEYSAQSINYYSVTGSSPNEVFTRLGYVVTSGNPISITMSSDGDNIFVGSDNNYLDHFKVLSDGSLSKKSERLLPGVPISMSMSSFVPRPKISTSEGTLYIGTVGGVSSYDITESGESTILTPLGTYTESRLSSPTGMDLDNNDHIYITNSLDSTIYTTKGDNEIPNQIVSSITLSNINNPQTISLSPDRKYAYVPSWGSGVYDGVNAINIYSVDEASGALSYSSTYDGQYAADKFYQIVVSPDGSKAYGTDTTTNNIVEFDVDTSNGSLTPSGIIIQQYKLYGYTNPTALGISEDGDDLYVMLDKVNGSDSDLWVTDLKKSNDFNMVGFQNLGSDEEESRNLNVHFVYKGRSIYTINSYGYGKKYMRRLYVSYTGNTSNTIGPPQRLEQIPESSEVITIKPPESSSLHIFFAGKNGVGYTANLVSEANNISGIYGGVESGIQAADAICNWEVRHADQNGLWHPNLVNEDGQVGYYKAMLVDNGYRRACVTNDCLGGIDEQRDWVFKGNTFYRNEQGKTVIETDSFKLPRFKYDNVLYTGGSSLHVDNQMLVWYTGLDYDYRSYLSVSQDQYYPTNIPPFCGFYGEVLIDDNVITSGADYELTYDYKSGDYKVYDATIGTFSYRNPMLRLYDTCAVQVKQIKDTRDTNITQVYGLMCVEQP